MSAIPQIAKAMVLSSGLVACGIGASAQGTEVAAGATSEPALTIELNALQELETGCNMSFLVENNLGSNLTKVVYETVLFDVEGKVKQLTLFDFGQVLQGKTRVRQFALAGQACSDLSALLLNGASACEGEGVDPLDCDRHLNAKSTTNVGLK